jgi:hypothetical protein
VITVHRKIAVARLTEELSADHAVVVYGPDSGVVIDRDSASATVTAPHELSDDALLHPYLAAVGSTFAVWRGRLALHAGAFVANGTAWGVIGDTQAGKSTLLGMLAFDAVPIVTDDMLVLEHGRAFAGPRTVDLRPDAADALGMGTWHRSHPKRERWRVRLPAVDAEVPLRGFFFLAWGSAVGLRRVPPSERLRRLLPQSAWPAWHHDPSRFVELASLPAWELVRPRDFAYTKEIVETVLDAVGQE